MRLFLVVFLLALVIVSSANAAETNGFRNWFPGSWSVEKVVRSVSTYQDPLFEGTSFSSFSSLLFSPRSCYLHLSTSLI